MKFTVLQLGIIFVAMLVGGFIGEAYRDWKGSRYGDPKGTQEPGPGIGPDPRWRKPSKPEGPFPRIMTKSEVMAMKKGCLFCKSHEVYAGAQGGLNTNFNCDNCGALYTLGPANLIPFGCQINHGPRAPRA